MEELVYIPLGLALGLAWLLLIGILWSPIGALTAFRLGRTKVRHPVRYAFVAAVSSATFLIPWFALVLASRGRYFMTDAALIFMFAAWLLGPLAVLFMFLLSVPGHWLPFLAGIVFVSGLGWLLSLAWAIRSRTRHAPQSAHLAAYRVMVPSVGCFSSEIVYLVMLVVNLGHID